MFSLECTSHYSMGDSSLHVDQIVHSAKSNQWPAIGLLENHTLSSVIEFIDECKKAGILGIIGCRFNTNVDGKTITLIAKNRNGYMNLVKILGRSQYIKDKPVVDLSDVLANTNDLILLLGGHNDISESPAFPHQNLWAKFESDIFALESASNKMLPSKCKKFKSEPCVYLTENDAILTRILFADKIGDTLLNAAKRDSEYFLPNLFAHTDYYIKPSSCYDPRKMDLAKKCESYEVAQAPQIPSYCENSIDLLRNLARDGWVKRKIHLLRETNPSLFQVYVDRVKSELAVFANAKVKLADYLLLVRDITDFCKKNKRSVGLRGSAAGCFLGYLIGICDVDAVWPDKSLPYHPSRSLMFERFYNAARETALPDIDIDLCPGIRTALKAFITNKYGDKNVSQNIVTFNRYDGRGALKTIFRVLNSVNPDEVDQITGDMINKDKISDELEDIRQEKPDYTTIEYNMDNNPKFSTSMGEYPRELELAIRISDNIFTSGKHAAGTVISPTPINESFPTIFTNDGTQIIGLEMSHAEAAGAVKYDLLCVSAYEKIDQILWMVSNKATTINPAMMDGEFIE